MNKPKKSKETKIKFVKTKYDYVEVPIEMTYICPERGEVTEIVMVKKYKPQESITPVTR